ncbi:exported hypothetical protein [Candidatus Competibacter denitrificans Run_A_D11]|uniref:Uncharacterized protein n=1 Tax=Candidatus Competibacter denitrificans Run_A_D11 TaxID=1400863 RepID=W6MD60_9GAMM|nr:hypothetical protein [Candidatus Competibacter denitrificans]CDI04645.1 exported hypothetical protein [Candidatus Competibacter denitrificans Run_A_D11]
MVNLRFFDFSVIAIFLLFLHAGNSHAGSKTCDNQLDVCGKRIDLENDRCWASCEKRYEDDFDAKDRCTDRCIQTSELADKTCIRNYDQCESSADSSPSPNPRSTLGAAQRQAENRERLAAKAQNCNWDVTWQQFAGYQQCVDAVSAAFLSLANRCMTGARNLTDYHFRSGRAGAAIDADLRKGDCPSKYSAIQSACLAYCQLTYW